jgi:TQXA domain-containing protein
MKTNKKSRLVALGVVAVMLISIFMTNLSVFATETSYEPEPQEEQLLADQLLDQQSTLGDFEDQSEEPDLFLACPFQVHFHEAGCYDEDGNVICGYADYVVHTHDASCFDSDGDLVCELPEVKLHTHDDSCYAIEEASTDVSETQEAAGTLSNTEDTEDAVPADQNLVCGQEEEEGHTHTEACYEKRLICGQEENEGHVHTEECYTEQTTLICGQEETEDGHIHTEDCYQTESVLSCGMEEGEGAHTHTEECYENVLICELPESEGHTHGESCYQQNETEASTDAEGDFQSTEETAEEFQADTQKRTLTCGKEEIQLHTHTDVCYDKDGNLICGKLEVLEHQHTAECFQDLNSLVATVADTSTGSKYVGYRGAFMEKDSEFSAGTYPYYIEEKTSFMNSGSSSHLSNGMVAYCYNKSRDYPYTYYDVSKTGDVIDTYIESEDASAAEFAQLAEGSSSSLSAAELKRKVMSVVLNGYPYNYSGFYNGNVSINTFRKITQFAVWYYTDQYYQVSSTANIDDCMSSAAASLYRKLINTELPDSVIESATFINLFQPVTVNSNGTTTPRTDIQNLLTVDIKSTPTLTNKLTLSKLVDGTGADTNKTFTFTIQLNASSRSEISKTFDVTPGVVEGSGAAAPSITSLSFPSATYSSSSGYYYTQATVQLKHGQSITIEDLPDSYYYYVVESDPGSDYYVSDIATNDSATTSKSGRYAKNWNSVRETEITFTNTKTSTTVQESNTLKLSKLVDGTYINPDEEFTFTIYLALSGYASQKTFDVTSDVVDGSGTTDAPSYSSLSFAYDSNNGYFAYGSSYYYWYKATVSLKHGQSIMIEGLPDTYRYQIYESSPGSDYSISSITANDNASTSKTSGYAINWNSKKNTEITYTNTCSKVNNTLKLAKVVKASDGTYLNPDEEYEFTVELAVSDYTTVYKKSFPVTTGVVTGAGATEAPKLSSISFIYNYDKSDSSSYYWFYQTVTLKPGQFIKVEGLPDTFKYTITEEDTGNENVVTAIDTNDSASKSVNKGTVFAWKSKQDTEVTYTNGKAEKQQGNTLQLGKLVDGTAIDTEQEFEFTIYLYMTDKVTGGKSFQVVPGVIEDSGVTEAPAYAKLDFTYVGLDSSYSYYGYKATVKLKHGQSITIEDLPDTVYYQITETDPGSDYKVTDISTNDDAYSSIRGRYIYNWRSEKNTEITFTNTCTKVNNTLQLSKLVDGTYVDPDKDFTFTIYIYATTYEELYKKVLSVVPGVVEGSGTKDAPDIRNISFTYDGYSNGYYYFYQTVTLKHGQSIKIEGLPDSYYYQIKETDPGTDYYVSNIVVNGKQASSSYINSGYIYAEKSQQDTEVTFTNTCTKEIKTLTLSKMVNGTGTYVNPDEEFEFTIYLAASDSSAIRKTFNVSPGVVEGAGVTEEPAITSLLFSSDGTGSGYYWSKATVKLKHGQSITIEDLPDDVYYDIVESDPGSGYTLSDITTNATNMTTSTSNREVQGWRSQTDTEVEYTNTRKTSSLTLGKLVEARFSKLDQDEFEFRIRLSDTVTNSDGTSTRPVTGTFDVTCGTIEGSKATPRTDISSLTFDSEGLATVRLRHGQTITVTGLPDGCTYTVTEMDNDAYTPSITSLPAGASRTETSQGLAVTGTCSGKISVQYTNTKNETVPTGIRTDWKPYGTILAMIFIFGILQLVNLRRRKAYRNTTRR